jgi:hypothetical protein
MVVLDHVVLVVPLEEIQVTTTVEHTVLDA